MPQLNPQDSRQGNVRAIFEARLVENVRDRRVAKLGVFDDVLNQIFAIKEELKRYPDFRVSKSGPELFWEEESTLILEEETAVELGDPRAGSLMTLLWGDPSLIEDGTIALAGPDLSECTQRKIPFGLVILAGAQFPDEYEFFRNLKDAFYAVKLKGFMARMLPSRNTIWCRVSKDAILQGFTLFHLGNAVIDSIKKVPGVSAAQVIMVTSTKEQVEKLKTVAEGAKRIVDAMVKMYSELNFDCESCDYRDVCETVNELKRIRDRLRKKVGDRQEDRR